MTTDPAARAAVHEERVAGFGTLRIVPLDPAADAGLVHRWVTQDRARFWGMLDHTVQQVREVYEFVDSLTTHHAFLALRDGAPAALLQTYDPGCDPVGDCYDVRPGDRGVHLLVGPAEAGAEPGHTGRLVGGLLRFVLADPAHLRVVAEPDARNDRAIARLLRSGFTLGPLIDKPEKRARLVFLDRAAAGL